MSRAILTDRLRFTAVCLFGAALALFVAGCGVHVTEGKSGDEKKKVDIETPVGSLHVRKDVNTADLGLAPYPGAQSAEDSEHENANVSIGSGAFGVKIIAAKYRTSDPPDKVVSFYTRELGKYGRVLNCPNGLTEHHDSNTSRDEEIRCSDTREPGRVDGETDLAVGTTGRQHIVHVIPEAQGTKFEMVYIQAHGATTM